LYGDVIECIDWSTGRILDALHSNDLLRKTVVIYTSDNGPKKGHGTAGPLRGFKHQPYEGGVRVPCVVSAPGRISAGTTVDAIVTVMDIYPTLVALAGATASGEQVRDGKDMWPLLAGAPDAKSPHSEFFYFVRHGVLVGIRRGRWKLLQYQGKTELYNLEADVGESTNLAKQHPDIVRKLATRLREFAADMTASRRPPGCP
jgi:arylsulfatase A-like enzyme